MSDRILVRHVSRIAGVVSVLGALVFVGACGPSPVTLPPESEAATVVVAFTPKAPSAVLPTLLPTVSLVPTELPPTPVPISVTTTPPATATTTATAIAAVTAATRRPVTLAPTRARATATGEIAAPFPEGTPGVYVTALRVEPATPKANEGGTFFVTFQNVGGEKQAYNWAIEIWDADNLKHPFGETEAQDAVMPPGISNLTSSGWSVKGQGECHAYRARVFARTQGNRAAFIQRDGSILWLDFSVCP